MTNLSQCPFEHDLLSDLFVKVIWLMAYLLSQCPFEHDLLSDRLSRQSRGMIPLCLNAPSSMTCFQTGDRFAMRSAHGGSQCPFEHDLLSDFRLITEFVGGAPVSMPLRA